MATETRLKMVYTTALGTVSHTWRYADTEATSTDIQALATATISNGSIFANTPLALKSAEIITTTSTDVTPA